MENNDNNKKMIISKFKEINCILNNIDSFEKYSLKKKIILKIKINYFQKILLQLKL